MDAISYQCWICPFCHDDHMSDGPCKQEDLKAEITKLRNTLTTNRNVQMTAMEIVKSMADHFEMKSGKKPTEISVAPELYDSLENELRAQPSFPADTVIDYIELYGVKIKRS